LRGNPGKRPFRRGLEPERAAEPPGCPDFMVRYAGEFGFSPAARARIAAGPGSTQPASKFDGLFGG